MQKHTGEVGHFIGLTRYNTGKTTVAAAAATAAAAAAAAAAKARVRR